MLEVSTERLIFAPSERLWREFSPAAMPAWALVGFKGVTGDQFNANESVTLSIPRLLGSQSVPAHVTMEAGKKLKFSLEGPRSGDEIEWILYAKNNSTRVAVTERFKAPGVAGAVARAMRRRRYERALRALELRTTGQEVSPLYTSR